MTKEEAKEYLDNYRKMYAELAPERFLEALDIMLDEPSLPSNLDEAADKAKELAYKTWSEGENWSDAAIKTFKAGIEWIERQGASYNTEVGWYDGPMVLDWPDDILDGFEIGDKVVVQIRKK